MTDLHSTVGIGPTKSGNSRPILAFVLGLAVLSLVGSYVHLLLLPALRKQRDALQSIGGRLDRIEESMSLFHFSRNPEGQPIDAILEHIEFWTEEEGRSGGNVLERSNIRKKLEMGKKALLALGAQSYPRIVEAFFDPKNAKRNRFQHRNVLLTLATEVDPERGEDLCYRLLLTPGALSGVRVLAARKLLVMDAQRAGIALRKVILAERSQGQPTSNLPYIEEGEPRALPKGASSGHYFSGFATLISYFMRSSYPGKEDTLLSVLRQAYHDGPTYVAAITGLRKLESTRATELLKSIFAKELSGRDLPQIRRKALRTLVDLEGAKLCSWLKDRKTREVDPTTKTVLTRLIRENCR